MHEHRFRQQNQVTNPFVFALELGYYAGLIWGAWSGYFTG